MIAADELIKRYQLARNTLVPFRHIRKAHPLKQKCTHFFTKTTRSCLYIVSDLNLKVNCGFLTLPV